MTKPPTIDEVVDRYFGEDLLDPADMRDGLKRDLTAREDAIAHELRTIASTMGTVPQFVAFALAEVGLGTPPDESTHTYLRDQFAAVYAAACGTTIERHPHLALMFGREVLCICGWRSANEYDTPDEVAQAEFQAHLEEVGHGPGA